MENSQICKNLKEPLWQKRKHKGNQKICRMKESETLTHEKQESSAKGKFIALKTKISNQ